MMFSSSQSNIAAQEQYKEQMKASSFLKIFRAGGRGHVRESLREGERMQVENLRYSRLKICVTTTALARPAALEFK